MIYFGGGYCIQLHDQAKALKLLLNSDVSGDLQNAINAYTENYHRIINKYQRCKGKDNTASQNFCCVCEEDKELMELIANLHRIFEKIPSFKTTEVLILYRGISGKCAAELQTQDTIIDFGFVSTTTLYNIAQEFAGPNGFVMTIHLPAGEYKLLPLNEDEFEVLLPPGAIFTKISTTQPIYEYSTS